MLSSLHNWDVEACQRREDGLTVMLATTEGFLLGLMVQKSFQGVWLDDVNSNEVVVALDWKYLYRVWKYEHHVCTDNNLQTQRQ